MMTEIISLAAVGVAIYSAVKVKQLSLQITSKTKFEKNSEQVKKFLDRLNAAQLSCLEMTLQFKAGTYQLSDIFNGDFEMIRDYNNLLNYMEEDNLINYHDIILQKINELACKAKYDAIV